MEFKIYARNFDDGVMIVGEKEAQCENMEGVKYPCIEVTKNTAEIMSRGFIEKDSDYWADAGLVDKSNYAFLVHELGGREKIVAMLEKK